MKTVDLVFQSDYSPEACALKLLEHIDPEQHTIFSLSGYRGKRPVIGSISSNEFRIHKRRYWHNDFAPVLYGNITQQGRGSYIEGYWGMQRWPRLFMRFWLIGVTLLGSPIFLLSVFRLITGKPMLEGDLLLGLLGPPGMLLFGFLLPKIGGALSSHEKAFLTAFVERTLVATKTNKTGEGRAWDSILE